MENKRYSIVRVDGRCPDFFCKYKVMKDEKSFSCNDCNLHRRYGDTKEQLIKKIIQVLRQPNGLIKGEDKQHTHRAEYLAKEIVEFLGVEE